MALPWNKIGSSLAYRLNSGDGRPHPSVRSGPGVGTVTIFYLMPAGLFPPHATTDREPEGGPCPLLLTRPGRVRWQLFGEFWRRISGKSAGMRYDYLVRRARAPSAVWVALRSQLLCRSELDRGGPHGPVSGNRQVY